MKSATSAPFGGLRFFNSRSVKIASSERLLAFRVRTADELLMSQLLVQLLERP